MTFESIRDAALLLTPEQREVLGEILLWSVHPKLDLTPAQAEDLARRVAEEDAGLAETIPWEVVREELRKKSDR
jgi:putative addiction module component (TIGR02574 family)